MPYLVLPSHHFASGWSQDREIRDFDSVTQLGVRYANEKNLTKKEELLLELVRYFHSYLFKYVSMIVSGTLPKTGDRINADSKILLKFFVPKGTKTTGFGLAKTARTLYLAFKGMETEEVYNVLVSCLIRALQRYDPTYTDKVKKAVEAVDSLITPLQPMVTSKQITEAAGFNCSRLCKMLVRRGYLERVEKPGKAKVKYLRKLNWPPDESLFNSGPIGLPYFVSFYFRHYLQQYITKEMKGLEARTTTVQLEHRNSRNQFGSYDGKGVPGEMRVQSIDGNLVDSKGQRWMADTELMNKDQDLGTLSLNWVQECNDPMFSGLSNRDRMFLYLVYRKEADPEEICLTLGLDPASYDQIHTEILGKCRETALKRAS